MRNLNICLSFAVIAYVLADLQIAIEYEMEQLLKNKEISWLSKVGRRPVKVSNFQWKDCGGEKSIVTIKKLAIDDPVEVPGDLTISMEANVKSAVTKLQADIIIYKKIRESWVKFPCIGGFGSCHYDDVCAMLKQITQCPQHLIDIGIKCRCPLKVKDYILPKTSFQIDAAVLEGKFHFIANTTNQAGKEAACLDFYLDFD